MTFPVKAALEGLSTDAYPNGKIPLSALVDVHDKENHVVYVSPEMAPGFVALRERIRNDWSEELAVDFSADAYRTYDQQVSTFISRTVYPAVGGLPTERYRTWNGKTYSFKPGTALAAVPGTSNHGRAAAVDVSLLRNGAYVGITSNGALFQWLLLGGADQYGFSWESQSEPWHLRIVAPYVAPIVDAVQIFPPPIADEVDVSYYRDDRATGWEIWYIGRDWTDALYGYPIGGTPRAGDWDLLDALGVVPKLVSFQSLVNVMNRQNRPTPLPHVSAAPVFAHTHTPGGVA